MSLSKICISRPVFATVLNCCLILFGLMGLSHLEWRYLPRMESPVASIQTVYPGASAETIEKELTSKIEAAVQTIEGVDFFESSSTYQRSYVTVNFKSNYPIEQGVSQLREAIAGMSRNLPDSVKDPVITKADLNSDPLMYITVRDEQRSLLMLTDYLNSNVVPRFLQLEGVGQVQVWGGHTPIIKLTPKMEALNSYAVSVLEVVKSLQSMNVNLQAGSFPHYSKNYTIISDPIIHSLASLKSLVIKQDNEKLIRLEDVATVEVAPESRSVFVRSNQTKAVVLAITAQNTANPLIVSAAAKQVMNQLQSQLPKSMTLNLDYDRARFIERSIYQVIKTLFEAALLVMLVVFGFLGSVRGMIIPIVAIPVSLISVFMLLNLFGYSLNNMTLLALVLAIGLVVDDAIVVLENIQRHLEKGKSVLDAAVIGSEEMVRPVLAMTLTLVAVYMPVAFMQGVSASLFKEFAFTLAGSVLVSGFIALTLSPMMASKWLVCPQMVAQSNYQSILDKVYYQTMMYYQQFLYQTIQYKKTILLTGFLIGLLGLIATQWLPNTLAPEEDSGVLMSIFTAPPGSNKQVLESESYTIESVFDSIKEKENALIIGGVPKSNQGIGVVILKDWKIRRKSAQDILTETVPQLSSLPGIQAFGFLPSPLPVMGGAPIQLVIQTTGSYSQLLETVSTLKQSLEDKNELFQNIRLNVSQDSPQIGLKINSENASRMGVSVDSISQILSYLLGGRSVTELVLDAKKYDVQFKLDVKEKRSPTDVQGIWLQNTVGELFPLSEVVEFHESHEMDSLPHFNKLRSATLSAYLASGVELGEAIDYIKTLTPHLGETIQTSWAGETKKYFESKNVLLIVLSLAIVFIYLFLAALFESFRQPLVILLTVPFSMTGAILLLLVTGGSFNLYTQIGLVTLIGLITKHGILIIEVANQLQKKGLDKSSAVQQASLQRLRPVLMTTIAMVLGAIPLTLSTGAGAYARQQLGFTIVGGMSIGTVCSLIFIPLMFILLAKETHGDLDPKTRDIASTA